MSAWPQSAKTSPALFGAEGELVAVRISVEPAELEFLLDTLSQLPFPVNPEIFHGWPTAVEFPAYRSRLAELRQVLNRRGIPSRQVKVSSMLDEILR